MYAFALAALLSLGGAVSAIATAGSLGESDHPESERVAVGQSQTVLEVTLLEATRIADSAGKPEPSLIGVRLASALPALADSAGEFRIVDIRTEQGRWWTTP